MYNRQLDTFLKTAELGSFGKAADALFISAPAVIQQINLLEAECGVRLFVRSNHGVRLTLPVPPLLEDAKPLSGFPEMPWRGPAGSAKPDRRLSVSVPPSSSNAACFRISGQRQAGSFPI